MNGLRDSVILTAIEHYANKYGILPTPMTIEYNIGNPLDNVRDSILSNEPRLLTLNWPYEWCLPSLDMDESLDSNDLLADAEYWLISQCISSDILTLLIDENLEDVIHAQEFWQDFIKTYSKFIQQRCLCGFSLNLPPVLAQS